MPVQSALLQLHRVRINISINFNALVEPINMLLNAKKIHRINNVLNIRFKNLFETFYRKSFKYKYLLCSTKLNTFLATRYYELYPI